METLVSTTARSFVTDGATALMAVSPFVSRLDCSHMRDSSPNSKQDRWRNIVLRVSSGATKRSIIKPRLRV